MVFAHASNKSFCEWFCDICEIEILFLWCRWICSWTSELHYSTCVMAPICFNLGSRQCWLRPRWRLFQHATLVVVLHAWWHLYVLPNVACVNAGFGRDDFSRSMRRTQNYFVASVVGIWKIDVILLTWLWQARQAGERNPICMVWYGMVWYGMYSMISIITKNKNSGELRRAALSPI